MNKIKDIEDFAKTRYAGAEKISNGSKEKGGLALLTWTCTPRYPSLTMLEIKFLLQR
jgi:hypothetical protein